MRLAALIAKAATTLFAKSKAVGTSFVDGKLISFVIALGMIFALYLEGDYLILKAFLGDKLTINNEFLLCHPS